MSEDQMDPDWDTPVTLPLTPSTIGQAIFANAHEVHTGWESCIDPALVVNEVLATNGDRHHCRMVEQEYEEEDDTSVVWHDWTVELKLGEIYMSAHWRVQVSASGADWDWCVNEAETAFSHACVLMGKRVIKGLVVVEPHELPQEIRH